MVALQDASFIYGQIHGLHGSAEVVFAGYGGVEFVGSSEEGDPAVAKADKVIDRRADTCGVVKEDGACLGSFKTKLGENDRDIVVSKLVKHRLFFAESEYGHTFNLALKHASDAGCEDGGVAV